jgi:TolA-binding protein
MEDRQEERGLKLIESVPLNFPKSQARFQALLFLGKHYAEKGDFALAIKKVTPVLQADDAEPDHRAEAMYRTGACQYGNSEYDRALATLRQVTEEYPWSVYANEAYYYIGLCHFQLKRWGKAVEALKLVGTSVPAAAEGENLVEAGQRFLVKVSDKDLRVVKTLGEKLTVQVKTQSGDAETIRMDAFDPQGETYLGAIRMELGLPVAGDDKLQIKGGDTLRVEYLDANTQDAKTQVTRLGVSRVVSTATCGFMDGALREYVHGVFADQKTFLRVKDFDADVSDQKDKIPVRVVCQYRPPVEQDAAAKDAGDAPSEPVVRDTISCALEETGPHSGFFAGTIVIGQTTNAVVSTQDAKIEAVDGDTIVIEYTDKEHIGGLDAPRKVTARAPFLTGEIPDVWVAHREVTTEELRARKNLLEAKFYLRLAQIFRDVGLLARSKDKADIGLEKTEDILRQSLKAHLPRDLAEEAYQTKWELMLAKGDLHGAIGTCRNLMTLYPASSLADVALMQIAKANLDAGDRGQAAQILQGVLGLATTSPDLKAEAQFLSAKILEDGISENLDEKQRLLAMGPAVEAYKACAEKFPSSSFAGQSLGKVIDFHLESKDYDRCQELLQQVFVDYPDAAFLDEMLLKWGMVLIRSNRHDEAKDKLQQLLRDYPNSALAGKAQKAVEQLAKRAAQP